MKLSNNLQFPREYFFKNENIKVTVEGSHFNPQSTIPRNEEISYREKLIITHKIYTFMQGYIKFPELNLPDNLNRNDDIEEMATKTRRYWGLGDGAIGNMVSLLESNGVLLSGINIDRKGASPYTQKQSLNKESLYVIALGNDKKSATIRNYDLAYELAGINIDRKGASPYTQKQSLNKESLYVIALGNDKKSATIRNYDLAYELAYIISNELNIPSKKFNADEFACAFLLPKDAFLDDLSNPNELDFYIEMKTKWLVPISIMIFRAYTLGVINYKKYNFLMNEMNKKGWLKKEPLDDNIKGVSPQALKTAVELLFENKINYKKYNFLMNEMNKKGWLKKEPLDDNIKGVSPQALKTAVELLFENNIMSKNTLMDNLANFGINMNPEDIEILIGLKEGTLGAKVNQGKNNNKNNVKIVDFKNKKRR